jgi:hypothetical protein
MTRTLKNAIAQIEKLPEQDQENIGRELMDHVAKLRALRSDLAAGLRSLDAKRGKTVDVEDVIRRARSDRAKTP